MFQKQHTPYNSLDTMMFGYQLPQSKIQTRSIHSEDITGNESHILDVRNDNEWNNGHLSQAVHVPHGKLLETDLPFNKNDVIYVHCQSGIRSSIAIGILEHKGYHNIINVNEGYKIYTFLNNYLC